jgi:hypothetical protein
MTEAIDQCSVTLKMINLLDFPGENVQDQVHGNRASCSIKYV